MRRRMAIPIFFSLLLLSFAVLHTGCGGGGSDANDTSAVIIGTVPEVKNAKIYINRDLLSPTTDLPFGSLVTVQTFMEDPDLDIVALYITVYVKDDNDGGYRAAAPGRVYDGPIVVDIEPEPWPYFSEVYEFTISYPPGNYLIGLQAEDENGNTSPEWTKSFRVIPTAPAKPDI